MPLTNKVSSSSSSILQLHFMSACTLIRKLNNYKLDGLQDVYSNHVTNASGRMHILLTLLINSMVIHGHWPPELLYSTIVSIPKDNKGSLSNSENYRGIALSNCI